MHEEKSGYDRGKANLPAVGLYLSYIDGQPAESGLLHYDSIVVGRYLGQTALAAVGSTMPVILLLAALMIGINVGVGIIISRYFGQKNEELMRRAFVLIDQLSRRLSSTALTTSSPT